MNIRHHRSHKVARIKAYPSAGDQLDALWQAIDSICAQSNVVLEPKSRDMLETIRAVKRAYPDGGVKKQQTGGSDG